MAGNLKPYFKILRQEATWITNAVAGGSGSGGTTASPALFNGIAANEWNTTNVMYWNGTSTYIDITINETCNIWRSGVTSYVTYNAPLKIEQYDGTTWNDITSSVTQTLSQIGNTQWEKTITNLPAGRYKFSYSARPRLDCEWYFESISKPLICNMVYDINSAKVGDIIPCRYSSVSSNMGAFSSLGIYSTNEINPYGTGTSDGVFYWVMVGYDLYGRKKFIADRNIQEGITWDTINSAGFAIGNNINYDMTLPLVAAWAMNEVNGSTVYDITGRYNGTVTGATIMSENNNYFRRFDNATDNYISYTNSIIPKGKKSIKFNFRTSNINTSTIYLLSTINDRTTGNEGLQVAITSTGQINVSFWNETATIFSILTNDMDYRDGNWHTVLFQWDGTITTNAIKLYIDSMTSPKITGTSTSSDLTLSYTGNLIIGRLPANSTNASVRYKGDFSNLEIYNDIIDPINTNITSVNNNYFIRLLTGGISSTDKENEWDQIIVGSNLNNTVTAGDNYIWNTFVPLSSWTSTIGSPNTARVLRGNSTSISGYTSTTSSTSSLSYGFRPELIVEPLSTPATFIGQLISSSVHTQDVELTGTISAANKAKYTILVNDVVCYDNATLQACPIGVDVVIPNSLLNINQNKITIKLVSDANIISMYYFYATVYNNAPSGVLSLSKTIIHAENIELTGTISDIDLDKVSYRVLINNIEKLSWSGFVEDTIIDYTILNSDLVVGNNNIRIEFKDNFKSVALGVWEQIVTKNNVTPDVNLTVANGTVTIRIIDSDNDLIKYKILINDKKVFPLTSDIPSYTGNYNINYAINRDDIIVGQNNTVTVYVEDILGGNVTKTATFMGEYIGIMFMDEKHEYYTTDIGQLLKYLDFGTITLGQTTEPKMFIIKNQYGFDVTNIHLAVVNSLPNINIEFSSTNDPFIPNNELIINDALISGKEIQCFLRLNTIISKDSVNGTFQISVKAQPV